jgi:hypothetical protein
MKLLTAFLLVATIALFAPVDAKKRYLDCPSCNSYSIVIVGGSFSGTGTVRDIYMVKKLVEQSGIPLKIVNMSEVLLIEYKSELGGDTRSVVTDNVNGEASENVKELYGYDGLPYYDIGTQRIPLLTCRKQRSYAIDAGSIQEFTPYLTTEYTRGKVLRCPEANFFDYSPEDPYGMPGSCTDDPVFIGDNSQPWSYEDIGPGYNYSSFANWAYMSEDLPLGVVNNYILYDYPNPVKCRDVDYNKCENEDGCSCNDYKEIDPNSPCGICFSEEAVGTFNLKAALIKTIGVEATAAFIQDYGGFYADFEQKLFNATVWRDYWLREYDTNLIYGYTVGGMQRGYIYKLATPILKEKNVLLNTFVKDLSWTKATNGELGVAITTNTNKKYFADFVIYTGQPEFIMNGSVTGDIPEEVIKSPEFKAVYSVPVYIVNVVLNDDDINFLSKLTPQNVKNDDTWTVEWSVLKGNGPDVLTGGRWEYRHTPYGEMTNSWRPSVPDFYTLTGAMDAKQAIDSGNTEVAQQLWDAIRVEQAYINNIDIETIPKTFKTLKIDAFETGYYYVWSNSSVSSSDLYNYARYPLGNKPFAFAHEAFNPTFLGWGQAGMDLGQCAVDRVIPGASFLIDCWNYHMFPPCDPSENCFSNGATVLGSETKIPSPYCTERWFINDYKETPNCVGSVELTKEMVAECKSLLQQGKIPITCP